MKRILFKSFKLTSPVLLALIIGYGSYLALANTLQPTISVLCMLKLLSFLYALNFAFAFLITYIQDKLSRGGKDV